jgi:putative ABC transport system permease protein
MKLLLEVIGLALAALRENKTRSFLTVLGVVIGTGTIIGVGSILTGLDGAVTGVMRSLGTNSAIVMKVRFQPGGGFLFGGRNSEERSRKPLTYENAVAIKERSQAVEHVSPVLELAFWNGGGVMHVRYKGNDSTGAMFQGTDEHFPDGGQVDIRSGRFFTDNENVHRMPVVVIGLDLYKSLFGMEEAVGKQITVNGHEMQVIGVMNRPAMALLGQNDNRVIMPYFTMHKMFPNANELRLIVQAKPGQLAAAIDELRVVLRQERHVKFSDPDNFFVSSSDQLVEQFRQLTAVTAIAMVVLSSIGLLVGGIGVMNIMLVSVTERTREIGVRKAIGARRSDIVTQFLAEAVVLTALGGIVGMAFGWSVSLASRLVFPSLPTAVPLWAAVLGVVVSIGIGLFFGIWPANKAARLDPVEALRYE